MAELRQEAPSGRGMMVDAELLSGARLLASGTWRASHEAFETAWRRSATSSVP